MGSGRRRSSLRLALAGASLATVLALTPALGAARDDQGSAAKPSAKAEGKGKGKGTKRGEGGGKRSPAKGKRRGRKRPGREFFGIQGFDVLSPGELSALRSARVGTVRTTLYWPRVERAPGGRNWVYSDYQVHTAARYGLRVFPHLLGTALQPGNYLAPPVHASSAVNGWATFVADAARRYGPGGEFWQLNPQLPYLPVTEWQVWNEESSNHGWNGAPSASEYASLVRSTADALRSVHRRARVVLGGILPHRRDPSGIPVRRFLRQLYREPGTRKAFDAVALHPYSPLPRQVLEHAQRVRKVMRRNHDGKTPLMITEIGWSSGGSLGGELATDEQGQARRLTKSYRLLLRHRRALRLKRIVWLMMRDYDRPESDYWVYRMGLFTARRVAKPAWAALAGVTGGEPAPIVEPPQGSLPPPPPPPPPDEPPCFLLIFC